MAPRTLALVSGGLDSLLAAKIVANQGVNVTVVNFQSIFAPSSEKRSGGVVDFARRFGFKLLRPSMDKFLVGLVKKPRYGYGKNMNPCVDCRTSLLKTTGEMLKEHNADFITTGEVVGQRPMSQVRARIGLIEKNTGLRGLILRPLSAKVLDPTIPEEKGWVDREKLYGIAGRGRHDQMKLAEELEIGPYPAPAGGCLLTYPDFGIKAEDLVNRGEATLHDFHLLKAGRHFRLDSGKKLVVGRNEKDNELVYSFANPGDLLLEPDEIPGPLTLLRGGGSDADIELAAGITLRYTKLQPGSSAEVHVMDFKLEKIKTFSTVVLPDSETRIFRVGL